MTRAQPVRVKSNALESPLPVGGVYMDRGREVVRLYAVRPIAMHGRELFLPGHYKTCLQPVVCGQVQAEKAIWEEWLTADQVRGRLEELQAQGWKIRPKGRGGR